MIHRSERIIDSQLSISLFLDEGLGIQGREVGLVRSEMIEDILGKTCSEHNLATYSTNLHLEIHFFLSDHTLIAVRKFFSGLFSFER